MVREAQATHIFEDKKFRSNKRNNTEKLPHERAPWIRGILPPHCAKCLTRRPTNHSIGTAWKKSPNCGLIE